MNQDLEILNGIPEIMAFWDPHMTKDCFYRNVRPYLDPILFERKYVNRRKVPKGGEKVDRYYTYKHLLLSFKLRFEKSKKS